MATKKTFVLRIDPELFSALNHWATDELRSVNGHIEFLLRATLRKHGRVHPRRCPHCQHVLQR